MQLIDRNTFITYANSIIQSSITIAHSEMIKKKDMMKNNSNNIICEIPRHITQKIVIKSTNLIRQSNRKKILNDNDDLLKGDAHQLFVENLNVNKVLNPIRAS